MHRAYSLLDVKEIVERDSDFLIKGIASTPTTDRMDDVVEPLGAKFKTPMPLLWQHKSDKPVGLVTFAKPTKTGIPFEATLPNIKEPGALKDRIDEAIQSIKYRLVAAVSIGFKAIEDAVEPLKDGGWRYLEWEWLELSLVTIPANAEATITSFKALDREHLRAVSGHNAGASRSSKSSAPTAVGTNAAPIPKGRPIMQTHRERIEALEAKRAANVARMADLDKKAADETREFNDEERQEFDGLDGGVKDIDEQLVRVKRMEQLAIAGAAPVNKAAGTDPAAASQARAPERSGVLFAGPNIEKGIRFARFVKAFAMANGNPLGALAVAEANKRWVDQTPEVIACIKAAVAAGTSHASAWADDLVYNQNLTADFIEYLRPATIIGRIPNLRRVPFNIRVGSVTSGGSASWVGQGAAIPMSKLQTGDMSLERTKAAGLMSITEELARDSSPSAEMLVRDDLRDVIAQFLDQRFIDPQWAAVSNVSPASITNGVTATNPSGTTAAALRTDMANLLDNFAANNIPVSGGVWIMPESMAIQIRFMTTSLGSPEFPSMGDGLLAGFPVIMSQTANVTGSPTIGNLIIFAIPREIFLADEGGVEVGVSNQASLEMDTAPSNSAASGTGASLVSMFQTNSIAIRAIRYINWKKRRSTAVEFIQNALYAA